MQLCGFVIQDRLLLAGFYPNGKCNQLKELQDTPKDSQNDY